jgi:transposase
MTPIDIDIPLPDDIETAHRLIRALLATLRQQTHLNETLQHQLEQLLRRIYGRKSEKLDPNQLLLFAREILEAAEPETTPEPTPEPAAPSPANRPTKGHGRKPLPANLTRRRVMHDVPPEQRLCPDCGGDRACIGEEVREQLEYVPASLIVK